MNKIKVVGSLIVLMVVLVVSFNNCQDFRGAEFKPTKEANETEWIANLSNIEDSCSGGEGNCVCSVEVNKLIDGQPYSIGNLQNYSGSTPENALIGGGSENIPLTCHAGIYLHDHRYEWIKEYIDLQKRADIGFGSRELFSAAYFQQTAGYILASHNHAIERGHSQLEASTSEWLRAYWSFLALTAVQNKVTSYSYTLESGLTSSDSPGDGYGLAITGTRTYPSSMRGVGLQNVFLSIALNHPNRDFGYNLNHSPGSNGGIRAFLRKVGYGLNSSGKVSLRSKSVSSRQVGLTDAERAALARFVETNGNEGLSTVLSFVQPYKLICPMTFLRTSQGTISWFGTSTQNGDHCGTQKGGPYSAVSLNQSQGLGKVLVRVKIDNNPTPIVVRRQGQQICAISTQLPQACIEIPSGNPTYEITVDQNGVRCVAGNCSGGAPNPPVPPNPNTTLPGVPPPPPPAGCSSNTLCLLQGRFRINATFQNQFNGTSGSAGVINNSDLTGFLHFGDPTNIELIVKVLNFGDSIKVFYGQLTNLRFQMNVYDTQTGRTKTYTNTPGDCGGIDQNFLVAGGVKVPKSDFESTKPRSIANSPAGTCTPGPQTLCLQNRRIKITGRWRNHYDNSSGAQAYRKLSEVTGGATFTDPANLELLIKALDFGDHYLILYGTLSDLEYEFTVTDTVTGRAKSYFNQAGNYCGGIDQNYFVK